jgi:YD repeat-containing protein
MIRLAIIALALAPIAAQAETLHDGAGRVIGRARTDANGVTTFSDAAGRTTAKARTDANGTTRFYDAAGRVTGTLRH